MSGHHKYLPKISDLDLMWLAGLLEGEGCFDNTSNGVPRIRLRMADPDVVDRAAMIVGLSIDKVKETSPRGVGKLVTYDIAIHGTPAIQLMQLLYLQMGGRRRDKITEILRASHGRYNV